jgi:hypothetical protein
VRYVDYDTGLPLEVLKAEAEEAKALATGSASAEEQR